MTTSSAEAGTVPVLQFVAVFQLRVLSLIHSTVAANDGAGCIKTGTSPVTTTILNCITPDLSILVIFFTILPLFSKLS